MATFVIISTRKSFLQVLFRWGRYSTVHCFYHIIQVRIKNIKQPRTIVIINRWADAPYRGLSEYNMAVCALAVLCGKCVYDTIFFMVLYGGVEL